MTYVGLRVWSLPPMISAIQAKKFNIGGRQAFFPFVIALVRQEKKNLQDIPVAREYSNVFSTSYSRLPPQREVEFGIECVPATNPISTA